MTRLALLAAALPAAALAQAPGSRMTRDYVAAAAQSDAFELAEAQSALAESKDEHVVGFARRMIRDHERMGAALRAATMQAGLQPPPEGMDGGQSMFLAALQSARGRDFDRLYWRQQALAHDAALVTVRAYAADGDDPAVRQAAVAALPMVQAHLAEAEQAERR